MSTKIYEPNGLPFWTADDIEIRNHVSNYLALQVEHVLLTQNRGWIMERIESPSLIPAELVSDNYELDGYFQVQSFQSGEFSLRPETTAASYEYARYRFEHQDIMPPYCVYQLAKSFRNENDQVLKNMRFKEFYQLEFQCLYADGTKNDYHKAVLEPLMWAIQRLTKLPTRLVPSDRLPSYSEKTIDIEVSTPHKWLEVCSISLRNDVPFEWNGKYLRNVEIAFGADRLVEVLNGE